MWGFLLRHMKILSHGALLLHFSTCIRSNLLFQSSQAHCCNLPKMCKCVCILEQVIDSVGSGRLGFESWIILHRTRFEQSIRPLTTRLCWTARCKKVWSTISARTLNLLLRLWATKFLHSPHADEGLRKMVYLVKYVKLLVCNFWAAWRQSCKLNE